jgi:hypothetical protein
MEASYFRDQAVDCRRYARLVADDVLRLRMLELALEFDEQAEKAEEEEEVKVTGSASAVISGRS